MKIIFLRFKRAIEYCFQYFLFEFPRGLDFSVRVKNKGITLKGNHGYALTSKKALKNILNNIPYVNKSLIDIGSGKGGVICYAYELGCKNCEGIEYEEFLHKIAQKNIIRLKYSDLVNSTNIDARNFERYPEFDIYFMFNPFDYDIFSTVINAIVRQNKALAGKNQEKYLICYGDANVESIKASNYFVLLTEKQCPYRGNLYRIFKSIEI